MVMMMVVPSPLNDDRAIMMVMVMVMVIVSSDNYLQFRAVMQFNQTSEIRCIGLRDTACDQSRSIASFASFAAKNAGW